MNNTVFTKTMVNIRKPRDTKLAITEKKNHLVSEPNYHTTKVFQKDLLALEMKKLKYL